MSVDQSQSDSLAYSWGQVFRPSHRTLPEQIVGLGLYLLVCFGFQFINGVTVDLSETFLGTFYFVSLALSMWILWRRYSLTVLKWELSLFLLQFLFQTLWSLSFFTLQQMLPALVFLLLLWCNTLLAALLFWKKERLSGSLLFFPLLWVFYLVGLNMVICISNP